MAHPKQVSVKPTATEAAIKEFEANIAQPAKESKAEAQQGETAPALQDLKPSGELVEEWDKAWESGKETAISTGFPALDALLDGGLYPGLYSMGAITSLGKTTFALQIADYIAASGKDVLYVTLEQSAAELASKTLSRMTKAMHPKSPGDWLTYRQITSKNKRSTLGPDQKKALADAIGEYKRGSGKHFYTLAGIGDVGVEKIRKQIEDHQKKHGTTPVIFIDYAQILAEYREKLTDKQNVDKNIVELKRMARDLNTPLFVISSLNRDNYVVRISLAAFKESGAIEYTSDCIIGLQPQGLEKGQDDKVKARNSQVIEKCKNSPTRKLEAVILKNRQGSCGGVNFEYDTLHNLYTDRGAAENPYTAQAEKPKQKTEAEHKRADQLPAGKPV